MLPQLLTAVLLLHRPDSAGIRKTAMSDTIALLNHRWLVTSCGKTAKKTDGMAGANKLYMNFFSNGGFDFVAMGDGDMLVWKYAGGKIRIARKSDPLAPAEAVYRIEKIAARALVISGTQAGATVRYTLTHAAGE